MRKTFRSRGRSRCGRGAPIDPATESHPLLTAVLGASMAGAWPTLSARQRIDGGGSDWPTLDAPLAGAADPPRAYHRRRRLLGGATAAMSGHVDGKSAAGASSQPRRRAAGREPVAFAAAAGSASRVGLD